MAAMCDPTILYHSTLELDSKQVSVTLTPKHIAVENTSRRTDNGPLDAKSRSATPCQLIQLDEVIAVQPHFPISSKDRFKIHKGGAVYQAVELQPVHPTSFDVYFVKRAPKHRWRHKSVTFTCKDHVLCSAWIDKIRDVLHAPGSPRPKHLLVFVNPYGGKKKAPKVFEKVRPLFDLANITLDVIETQRQYHARDVLQTYHLRTIDGVICVGGDGTFSEVLNGLLDRYCFDKGIGQSFRHQPACPELRIGVIPAGSTDAIVYTTTGINDPVTSVLQIIIGDSIGVDVNALYKQEEFVKYSVTMTGYGYYGDLLADSERLRWMGPKRYTWSGFKKFMLNRTYEGEVSYLPADEYNGTPRDGKRCYTGCMVCQRAGKEAELASKAMNRNSSVPAFDLGTGKITDVVESEGWRRVAGKFVAINTVTVSCRCAMSPEGMSPYTHLGDGCMDLILVFDCSRINYLRHLSRIPQRNSDQFDFSFVQVHRVREFQFRPKEEPAEQLEQAEEGAAMGQGSGAAMGQGSDASMDRWSKLSGSSGASSQKALKHSPSQTSVWNCDGELVSHPNLHIQVHCQLVRLFARGVEDCGKQEQDTCPTCCNACSNC